jgi:hypothetical protein
MSVPPACPDDPDLWKTLGLRAVRGGALMNETGTYFVL